MNQRTNQEKATSATSAKSLHERQLHYDRLHHAMRIQWLTGENPRYSCGTPVLKSDALKMKQASESQLKSGLSSNSVDLADSKYLAELDQFTATQH